jgi:prepilin-type processing-associated H-X9-DG protein
MGAFISESRAWRVSGWSIAACCAIVVVTSLVLAPVFVHTGHYAPNSDCQSNLKMIGCALKMYLAEWHDAYPTNRGFLSNGGLGRTAVRVKLTPAGEKNPDGFRPRYRYGVNWVEALIPYTDSICGDGFRYWACGTVGKKRYPESSHTVAVSYAFNRNLIERPENVIQTASNMLMVREMDRRVDAELRPTNYSCGRPDVPPDSAFLTGHDSRIGKTSPKLHNMGSNVLFADGHVKNFSTESLPDKPRWDPQDRQWYNCLDPSRLGQCKSIAITP